MKILFMCVANSARSQLAEGWAKNLFPDAEIQSAGSRPGKLNPFAVESMNDIGIDISSQYSKSYDDLSPTFIAGLDYVITLCAEEVCPVIISKAKKLHWPIPDPAGHENLSPGEQLQLFNSARESIKSRLIQWKDELKA